MKRLVFIVEGNSEIRFINQTVIPYLYGLGYINAMNAQTIVTNRKQHKKGGVVNYEYLKNDLTRVFAQGNVIVTTMLDFFRLPTNFPAYSTESSAIDAIENGMLADFSDKEDFYIPYIQKHEFEALMFSDSTGFALVLDTPDAVEKINAIITEFPNPEDINNSPQTAPSKRLEAIFNYDKVADSDFILSEIGIETIMEKCPRFKIWIQRIVEKLEKT